MESSELEQLIAYADAYGITLSTSQTDLILRHLDLVIEKNKVLNLTRITDRHSALLLHCLDSLLVYPSFVAAGLDENKSFLDLGTGAGFPGIPLAIISGMHGTLLDSVAKKVRAVDEFIDALQLSDRLVTSDLRAEELAHKKDQRFDYVTARAVAELHVLIEYASPLLEAHGSLIVSKANPSDDELSHAQAVEGICGMKLVSRETYELPEESGHREIFVYQKSGYPKVKLPRRTGMAKHSPLYEMMLDKKSQR